MIYKGKQLSRRPKTSLKPQAYDNPNKKHIGCSPVEFAFQSSRVCAFCFWIFKINFLSFWSREENLHSKTGERSAFMVILSRNMAAWGWAQEGSRGDAGAGRALPSLSSLSMAGRARGGSRACQQPWVPRGDGLVPGLSTGDWAGSGDRAMVWVRIPLRPSLSTGCW